jgi:hypothetical protein
MSNEVQTTLVGHQAEQQTHNSSLYTDIVIIQKSQHSAIRQAWKNAFRVFHVTKQIVIHCITTNGILDTHLLGQLSVGTTSGYLRNSLNKARADFFFRKVDRDVIRMCCTSLVRDSANSWPPTFAIVARA